MTPLESSKSDTPKCGVSCYYNWQQQLGLSTLVVVINQAPREHLVLVLITIVIYDCKKFITLATAAMKEKTYD